MPDYGLTRALAQTRSNLRQIQPGFIFYPSGGATNNNPITGRWVRYPVLQRSRIIKALWYVDAKTTSNATAKMQLRLARAQSESNLFSATAINFSKTFTSGKADQWNSIGLSRFKTSVLVPGDVVLLSSLVSNVGGSPPKGLTIQLWCEDDG